MVHPGGPWGLWVENHINSTYRVRVSAEAKSKPLLKFGESDVVGTSWSTLWSLGGDETYVSTNAITTISSSSASDTEPVKIEYHTVDASGNFTFAVQSATLTGQTEVTLTTPCARVSRVYNVGTADLVGDVYVYEDDTVVAGVPQTTSKIHAKIDAGFNQTQKAATTISNNDYWAINELTVQVTEKATAWAEVHLEIREKGGVFRPLMHLACSDQTGHRATFGPPIIVPSNADIRLRALASGANTSVGGAINGYLLIKVP
jgi:hypothetical protein